MKTYRLGIIAAMEWEADIIRDVLTRYPSKDLDVSLICSGMGSLAARQAAEQLATTPVNALISCGCCGGLKPDLKTGDTIISTPAAAAISIDTLNQHWQQRCIESCTTLPAPVRVCSGTIVNTETAIATASQKHHLYQQTRAAGVDMESLSIMQVSQQHSIPSLVIRCVLDTANDNIPTAFIDSCDQFGRVKWTALANNLLRHPGALLQAGKLSRQQQQVKEHLKTTLLHLHQNAWLLPMLA